MSRRRADYLAQSASGRGAMTEPARTGRVASSTIGGGSAPRTKMRVLGLTNLFPTPAEPTRGVFNLQRWAPLAARCELRVVTPVPWHHWWRTCGRWRLSHQARVGGICTHYLPYFMTPRVARGLYAAEMYCSLLPALQALHRQHSFDAILAAWAYPDATTAVLLGKLWKVPVVTMVLGSDLNELPASGLRRLQTAWTLRNSASVVAVSHGLARKAIELGADPARVVTQHNGVDGELFRIQDRDSARRALQLPTGRRILLFVGNLKPVKGLDVLLHALARLKGALRDDLLLAVVGDGPLRERLHSLAGSLKISQSVRFCGRQPHSDIPEWLAAADALCLPSRMEGCPNVVIEALASGRPVIASRVGGIPELMDDRCGVLVPPEDPESLSCAIEHVLHRTWDPAELRSRAPALSWDRYGQVLYEQLLGAPLAEEVRDTHPLQV